MYEEEFKCALSKNEFMQLLQKKYHMKTQSAHRAWYRFSKDQRKEKEETKEVYLLRKEKYVHLFEQVHGEKDKFFALMQELYHTNKDTARREFYKIRKEFAQAPSSKIFTLKENQKNFLLQSGVQVLQEKVEQPVARICYPAELIRKPNMLRMREYSEFKVFIQHRPTREELRKLHFSEHEINWLENFEAQEKMIEK